MLKNRLGLEKLNAKKLCILAMLTALTVVLAVYGTFRIGNLIKIPTKFIVVWITAAIFGPVWGGVVAAIGDILNSFLMPVGPWLVQITAVEFLCGFVFGLFFYKRETRYLLRTVLCALVLTALDIILMSLLLTQVGYFPSFTAAVGIRALASGIKCALYIAVCLIFKNSLASFERRLNL